MKKKIIKVIVVLFAIYNVVWLANWIPHKYISLKTLSEYREGNYVYTVVAPSYLSFKTVYNITYCPTKPLEESEVTVAEIYVERLPFAKGDVSVEVITYKANEGCKIKYSDASTYTSSCEEIHMVKDKNSISFDEEKQNLIDDIYDKAYTKWGILGQ